MLPVSIFDKKVPIFDKLQEFGFKFLDNRHVYSCKIADNQFELTVEVFTDGSVKTKVIDPDTAEEYVLHLAQNAEGRFVGKVRTEYNRVLQRIADNCFAAEVFESAYAKEVIKYVRQAYHDEFEFLWEKFPDNAIVRRQDNKKWYAAILTVAKSKIGLAGDGKVEVIDLRMRTEEIERRVDGKKYFPGYHMNKKHWVTICLDGSVGTEEILSLIDASYVLAKK